MAEAAERLGEGGVVRRLGVGGTAQHQAVVEPLQCERRVAHHQGRADHRSAVAGACRRPPGPWLAVRRGQAGAVIENAAQNRERGAGEHLFLADAVDASAGGGAERRADPGDEGARGHPCAAESIADLKVAVEAGHRQHRFGDGTLQRALAGGEGGDVAEDGERGGAAERLALADGVDAFAAAGFECRQDGGDAGAGENAGP